MNLLEFTIGSDVRHTEREESRMSSRFFAWATGSYRDTINWVGKEHRWIRCFVPLLFGFAGSRNSVLDRFSLRSLLRYPEVLRQQLGVEWRVWAEDTDLGIIGIRWHLKLLYWMRSLKIEYKSGFLNLCTISIWGQIIIMGVGLYIMVYWAATQASTCYLAIAPTTPVVTNKNLSSPCGWGKNGPSQSHSCR